MLQLSYNLNYASLKGNTISIIVSIYQTQREAKIQPEDQDLCSIHYVVK